MNKYTQCRGWLNVNSIEQVANNELKERFEKAQADFKELHADDDEFRSWVCEDTVFHSGSNHATFIFFGTELKNYDFPAESWIKFLLDYFKNAEGCIFFQKDDDIDGKNKVWIISKGHIVEEKNLSFPFTGYGNFYN